MSSIGHGARSLDEFVAALEAAGIREVVDVRTAPASRKHPHFGSDALARSLEGRGMRYLHLGELGGWRRSRPDSANVALRSPGFRGYADHLESEEFARGYATLLQVARAVPTAFMCAETLWWRCHRRILADRLVADGWEVVHLLRPGESTPHRLSREGHVVGGRLTYDRAEVALPLDAL